MANPARFWNFIAKRYARQPIADQSSYEQKLKLTREHLTPSSKVLELGCGTGSTALLHAPHVESILAIDFSERMIDIAQAKLADTPQANVKFECRSVESIARSGDSYDVVMAHSVLHLLDDRITALDAVANILKPDGVFVSSTICLADSMRWARYVLPIGHRLGLLPRVHFFSSEQLVEEVENAGFSIAQKWSPAPNKAMFLVAKRVVI